MAQIENSLPPLRPYDPAMVKDKMSRRRRRRMLWVVAGMISLGLAVSAVLIALEDNLLYFRTPAQALADDAVLAGGKFRLGGLVQEGSITNRGEAVEFTVSDGVRSMVVRYGGIVPDLFREGQGVVAEGRLDKSRTFVAETLFAKHDENYRPPEDFDTGVSDQSEY